MKPEAQAAQEREAPVLISDSVSGMEIRRQDGFRRQRKTEGKLLSAHRDIGKEFGDLWHPDSR